MTSRVFSAAALGFEGKLIEIECDASNGLPSLLIVGLGGKAIDEARGRVRSAIKNSGLDFPRKRITINLAPANLPKTGTHFDLAIALSLLQISGQLKAEVLHNTLSIGELGLDGSIRPVRGVISYVQTAAENNIQRVILPATNYGQASLIKNTQLVAVENLRQLISYLQNKTPLKPPTLKPISKLAKPAVHLSEIRGQDQAKRALLIAAAGNHNLLLSGPPGAGKTMLAKAVTSLLPPLSPQEIIEVTKLHSLAGEIEESIIQARPFRSPHHSASHIAIVGGGQFSRPGEISLAHRGVLFLDELPEYSRQTLESLRQPLEDKLIHISRAESRATYPADCMLIATQNPCPCGYAGDQTATCSCSLNQILAYQKRISGPLLDRIDIFVSLSRVKHQTLLQSPQATDPSIYPDAVHRARKQQSTRFKSFAITNASLDTNYLQAHAKLSAKAKSLLNQAAEQFQLTARSYFKVIKIGQTIADIEASSTIQELHISEALQYRRRNP